jgi:hypothetical protein
MTFQSEPNEGRSKKMQDGKPTKKAVHKTPAKKAPVKKASKKAGK